MKMVHINLITQLLLEAAVVAELKVMEMLEPQPEVLEDIENPQVLLLDVIQDHP
jgi:hypothetical protein